MDEETGKSKNRLPYQAHFSITAFLWGLVVAYVIGLGMETAVQNPLEPASASLLLLLIVVYAGTCVFSLGYILRKEDSPLKTYGKNFLIGYSWLLVGLICERVINICKGKSNGAYVLSLLGLWVLSSLILLFVVPTVMILT